MAFACSFWLFLTLLQRNNDPHENNLSWHPRQANWQNVSQSGRDAAPSSGCYFKILAIHKAILSYKWYLALYFKKCSLVKVLSFYPYIHDFLVIFTLMTVYKTVSHHNGPFSTASKHKNEKVSIHMC